MHKALNGVGQTYKSFLVTKYFPLIELNSLLIELVHEPTGARVIHIANDDPESLFCLSFQTLPTSSNGVAHILEHTVLCGSKKFPVKDPFFAMTRRSLHTFMNALTGQDFTCYPASSQVEKDFYNLLEVYLDAVFFPELKKLSFLQEGHRLQFSDGKLQFQGVVYNEMKGAMTSSESRLWQAIAKHLLPNLPYAYNAGGDPKEIPSLSYEELLEFHRAYYHPSRCLFFFYGGLPLTKHLDFIERHALKKAEKTSLLDPLPLQPRFTGPIRAVDFYSVDANENLEGKTQIAFSWLTAHLSQQSDVLALSLLECILLETDASPLKMALLKSELCKEVDASLDIEMSEIPFSVVCRGCDTANEEELQKLLFKTLRTIASKPIDPNLIEAALHQLEFQRTEIAGEGGPFGLTLFMRAALLKQHGNEPEHALLVHSLFAELRDRLKDKDYLPGLIRKYFLDNRHFLTQILIPDPEMEKREQENEQERLRQIEARLSESEKQAIIKQTAELLKYQETIEHQSTDCLPKVTLQDIPPHPKDFPLIHSETKHFDVYYHNCFTNQIIYADFLFDLPHIEAEDLPLLSFLSKIWTELGCGGKSYEETLQFMQAHIGEIDAHLALHVSANDPNVLMPAFSLRGKALRRKAEPFFQLLYDLAHGPDFSDRARLRECLLQHATELEHDLARNAINYAIQLTLSGYSTASYIYNQWHGLPYYQFIKRIASDKKGQWMKRLSELAKKLISSGKPHLILSCGKEEYDELKKANFYKLSAFEPTAKMDLWKGNYPLLAIESQIRLMPSPVAFTALGFRTASYCDPGVAELMISTQLLENVVLHKEIREKGGAYGSSASYAPTTGNYHLYSYRDPHFAQTLESFAKAIDRIGAGAFTDQELEEAKIGLIGAMDTPVVPGGRAIVAYSWLRSGRTYEARQNLRNEIFTATREQVAAGVLQNIKKHAVTVVSFMGEELAKKEERTGLPVKELLSI
jgi:Zn-dependent M16 (insulinase) family peptidase